MVILLEILFTLWFFLPAGLANAAPIFAARLPLLKSFTYPLDCYATFRGRRILGSHKTVRGLFSGVLIGTLTVFLQVFLYEQVPAVKSFVGIDYAAINPVLLGMLASVGALAGDAVKSFVKRQMDIQPGKSWFPFDQIDYILGGILFTSFYIRLSFFQYAILCIVWFLLHPLATFIGYELRLKERPI
jgi:CDP-2,3-bis-(O-geranylgeranyl)-sn-glycerol synthase